MLQNVARVSTVTSIFRFFFRITILWPILLSNNESTFNATEGIYIKFVGCSTSVLSNKIGFSHMNILIK